MRKKTQLTRLFGVIIMLSVTRLGAAEVQPGDTITRENIAQADEFLTPSTRWMVEQGMTMNVIETKPVHWPKLYQEATQKYAAQVKLGSEGRELLEYTAGCPFPQIDPNDPLAGHKVMWNYGLPSYDSSGTEVTHTYIDKAGAVVRSFSTPVRRMFWTGRVYNEPKPMIPSSPQVHYTDLFGPVEVPEWNARGAMNLFIRYLSPTKPDTAYFYDPAKRHVMSLHMKDPSRPWFGSDIDFDSYYGFSGKLGLWTFRLLAEKEILAVVHSGKYGDPSAWCAPRDGKHGILAALPCVSWEKRKVWVIEGIPASYPASYAYSKRVLYIDQEFFGLVTTDLYDLAGELWKGALSSFFYTTKPHAKYPIRPIEGGQYNYTDEWPFLTSFVMVDMQKVQASISETPSGQLQQSEWDLEWFFNEEGPFTDPSLHTVRSLRAIH